MFISLMKNMVKDSAEETHRVKSGGLEVRSVELE